MDYPMLVRLTMPPLVSLAILTLLHSLFQGQTHLWHKASQTAPAAKCLMPNRLRQVGDTDTLNLPSSACSPCCPAQHGSGEGTRL